MSCTKAVLRTIFYQNLLLLIGLTLGFILNAEYVGWKAPVISRSFQNIFYPVKMDENICQKIKSFGQLRIWAELDRPEKFNVIEDGLASEEWYVAKISYQNKDHRKVTKILSTRIRWKPWEYYYNDSPKILTEEELLDYNANDTLNSRETDKAIKLFRERSEMNKQKIET